MMELPIQLDSKAQLSEHFTLGEFTISKNHPEVYNIPTHEAIANLKRLCGWLEVLRKRYNERYVLDQTTPGPSRSASPLGSSKNSGGEIEDARVHFLMAIFDAKKPYRCLRRMPDYQFQLILIWWQSQMAWCQQKFKRCFKKSDSGGGALPIELYTRSTATLQKYLSLSEEQIDCQPALVILQHLEDMSREAEEMERIRRHSKH